MSDTPKMPTSSFRNYSFTYFFPKDMDAFQQFHEKHASCLQFVKFDRHMVEFIPKIQSQSEIQKDHDTFRQLLMEMFEKIIELSHNRIKFVIGQIELCKTSQRPHLQGFLNCDKLTFKTVLKTLPPTTHLEISRCSAQTNINYCTKSKTRLLPHVFVGEPPKGQGHRTDIEHVYECAMDLIPTDQMLVTLGHEGMRNIQLYQRTLDTLLGLDPAENKRAQIIADHRQAHLERLNKLRNAAAGNDDV